MKMHGEKKAAGKSKMHYKTSGRSGKAGAEYRSGGRVHTKRTGKTRA